MKRTQFKQVSLEILTVEPSVVSRFHTGAIPNDHMVLRPVNEELPKNEQGRKYLPFDYVGRGRLLSELLAIHNESEPYVCTNPEEEDIRSNSATAFNYLSAFLSDIAVEFPAQETVEGVPSGLLPLVRYKLFDAKHVVYYPDWEDSHFVQYRALLDKYNELTQQGEHVPTELVAKLDFLSGRLFEGDANRLLRQDAMNAAVQFLLGTSVVNIAILRIFHGPDGVADLLDQAETCNSSISPATLYPNSHEFKLGKEWGMPKFIADNWNKVMKVATRSGAEQQFEQSSPNVRTRKSAFKVKGRETETEFVFDQERLAIKTAGQFADQLLKVRDAKVLQTFFALVKWANIQDSAVYRDVPISDIMALIFKESAGNRFNTAQRREFSAVLEYLASMSITVDVIGQEINKRTGKAKPTLKVEKGVKIFRLVATYSVRKEFQSLPKDELQRHHFDESVITKFSGELLPGKSHLLGQRASIYFDSLLHFDVNKDSKAIVLGFQIQTRFNQLRDKAQVVEFDRGFLVDLCEYAKTDKTNPAKATQQIANSLDKLIKAGIITKYTGLTNRNSDRVRLWPPATPTLQAA